MSALRILRRFSELLDIKVTRAAAAWLRLNTDGTVTERTGAQTLGDLGVTVLATTTPGTGVAAALGIAANTAGGVLTHGSAISGTTGTFSGAISGTAGLVLAHTTGGATKVSVLGSGIRLNTSTGYQVDLDNDGWWPSYNQPLGKAGKPWGRLRCEGVTSSTTADSTFGGNLTASGSVTATGKISASIPSYANDAAADADATLLTGQLYRITGSRAVYQK